MLNKPLPVSDVQHSLVLRIHRPCFVSPDDNAQYNKGVSCNSFRWEHEFVTSFNNCALPGLSTVAVSFFTERARRLELRCVFSKYNSDPPVLSTTYSLL